MVMEKSHKHTKRSDHYRTMAQGFEILRSPLAQAYNAAAEHYRETDPPLDPMPDEAATEESERDTRR
jgi:hypothetical protein